jgi:phosphoheptose isomerase
MEGSQHVAALGASLDRLGGQLERVELWGQELTDRLLDDHRLLVAGNGGSAAEAQHLTAELVGRYRNEREPLSAICLHADSSSVTAICNDYGPEEVFARQVRAHGRAGDVLLLLSTSGRSPNLLAAAHAAGEREITTWALTGPAPNPLAEEVDEAVCVEAATAATVQEVHLMLLHVVCGALDRQLERAGGVTAAA